MQEQIAPVPAAPPSLTWPRLDRAHRATLPLLAGCLAAGVLFDLALRSLSGGLGMAASVWAVVAVLLVTRWSGNRWTAACLGAAALLAGGQVLRASPWLVVPDLLTIPVLVWGAVLLGRDGSLLDLHLWPLAGRSLSALARLVWVPGWLVSPLVVPVGHIAKGRGSVIAAVVRGLAIAVPIVLVLGLLLGSADPVFASFLHLDRSVDTSDIVLHAVLISIGTLWLGAAAAAVSIEHPAMAPARVRLGGREALVVMVVIDGLFALFAVAQVVAARGGGASALHDAGVTYAEYARSGFFQLLWVAALTWVVAAVARRVSRTSRGRPGTR